MICQTKIEFFLPINVHWSIICFHIFFNNFTYTTCNGVLSIHACKEIQAAIQSAVSSHHRRQLSKFFCSFLHGEKICKSLKFLAPDAEDKMWSLNVILTLIIGSARADVWCNRLLLSQVVFNKKTAHDIYFKLTFQL